MNFLKNMKIGFKMTILIMLAIVVLGANSFFTINSMKAMNQSSSDLYANFVLPVNWLNVIIANKNRINADMFEVMQNIDDARGKQLVTDIDDLTAKNDKLFDYYLKTTLTPFEKENIPSIKKP